MMDGKFGNLTLMPNGKNAYKYRYFDELFPVQISLLC